MKCKLCLSNKKLIGKSHPLPDFLYKDLYDEKHRLHKVKLPGISTGYYTQTGEYDRHLLCADCDNNILGRLDSYGNDSLIEGLVKYESETIKHEMRSNALGLDIQFWTGLNYERFKLFLLSLLWRSSISQREMFKGVELAEHEETLRSMVYSGFPDEPDIYPSIIFRYDHVDILPTDLITEPFPFGDKASPSGYVFPILGMYILYYLPDGLRPLYDELCPVNKEGEMRAILLPKDQALKYFKSNFVSRN